MEFDYNNPPKDKCPNVMCGQKKDDCCGITKVVIAAVLGDDSKDSKVAPFNGAYCNKIVEYEANGAIYFYSSDGIYTKLGNKSKSEEAASVEYVDQKTRYAINQSKNYTDTEIDAAAAAMTTYVDGGDAAVLADAKNYADEKDVETLATANTYADGVGITTLADAKTYADGVGAAALADAKAYTDSAASSVVTRTYVDNGDASSLAQAESYTDTKIGQVNNAISTLESSLATVATSGSYADLSNAPVVPQFLLTSTDPGEGSPLAENTFIGVYS
jgi:hypothetical protein